MAEQNYGIVDLDFLDSCSNYENQLNIAEEVQISEQQCQKVIMAENIKPNKIIKNKPQRLNKKKQNQDKVSKHWTDYQMKKYWLFIRGLSKQHKLVKTSWTNWKGDKFFIRMEQLFKKTRTHRQIKSFDQRMKKKYLQQKNIDLCDAIQIQLKELKISKEQQEQIQKELQQYFYANKSKKQQQLSQQQYKLINQKLDDDIQQQKIMAVDLKNLIGQFFPQKKQQKNQEYEENFEEQFFYQ